MRSAAIGRLLKHQNNELGFMDDQGTNITLSDSEHFQYMELYMCVFFVCV